MNVRDRKLSLSMRTHSPDKRSYFYINKYIRWVISCMMMFNNVDINIISSLSSLIAYADVLLIYVCVCVWLLLFYAAAVKRRDQVNTNTPTQPLPYHVLQCNMSTKFLSYQWLILDSSRSFDANINWCLFILTHLTFVYTHHHHPIFRCLIYLEFDNGL